MMNKLVAYLFSVQSFGCVEGLNDGSGVANDKSVTGGTDHHTDHREPDVDNTVRRITTVTDTEHV